MRVKYGVLPCQVALVLRYPAPPPSPKLSGVRPGQDQQDPRRRPHPRDQTVLFWFTEGDELTLFVVLTP